jgi:DNA-binding response OmpR family regulator
MKVLYVSSHPGAKERLERQFSEVEWVPFHIGMEDFQIYDAVLILEPFECLGKSERKENSQKGGLYTSVFVLWKRFLAFHYPEVKLLVGGFGYSEHPNYLNLPALSGRTDFSKLVRVANAVTDEWEDHVPVRGEDIQDKLKLFFEGHNKEGIIITMTKVRQGLNHAYYDYGGREVRLGLFRRIWMETLVPLRNYIRLMQRRWENYAPFFENMPFYYQLSAVKVDDFFQELEILIKGTRKLNDQELKEKQQHFIDFDGFNRLDELQQALDLINKRYINPEIIGTVLMIDDDPDFHNKLENSLPIFKFDHAYSGEEGLAKAQEKSYNMILLDLQLDPKDETLTGLDYIQPLKLEQSTTPLLIVTTHARPKIYKKAIELGADNFFIKSEFDVRQWSNQFLLITSGKGEDKYSQLGKEFPSGDQKEGKSQVLVIEDEDEWYKKIESIQGKAINFQRAGTQQVALDLVKDQNNNYDLILLDLYLPGQDRKEGLVGLKLISLLKEAKPLVPIIVISRNYTYSMTIEAINQGASDYLRKDRFNAQLWYNRFKNYIELKKSRELIEKTKLLS